MKELENKKELESVKELNEKEETMVAGGTGPFCPDNNPNERPDRNNGQ